MFKAGKAVWFSCDTEEYFSVSQKTADPIQEEKTITSLMKEDIGRNPVLVIVL